MNKIDDLLFALSSSNDPQERSNILFLIWDSVSLGEFTAESIESIIKAVCDFFENGTLQDRKFVFDILSRIGGEDLLRQRARNELQYAYDCFRIANCYLSDILYYIKLCENPGIEGAPENELDVEKNLRYAFALLNTPTIPTTEEGASCRSK
jgi:hypothetical protein